MREKPAIRTQPRARFEGPASTGTLPCRLLWIVGALALALSSASPLSALQQDSRDARVVITIDSLDRAAFANVAELLQARVPGLHIERNGEGGMRWFMRGPASVEDISPLVFIDGVRLSAANSSFRATGTRPPVLDDIDIEDVERVEVWSGPATAARYGTGSAQGVIRIVTFAPAASASTLRVTAAGGMIDDNTTYPANYHRVGVTAGGALVPCDLFLQARGGCVPTGPPTSINVLESDSPFETGTAARVAATLTGGDEGLSWRGGATFDRAGSPTGAVSQRFHVRGAGSIRATEQMNLTLRAHWTRGGADLPPLDQPSLLRQGLFARADTIWAGFSVPHTSDYGSDRYGAVLTGVWQPRGWVDLRLTSGLERLVDEDDLEYLIPDVNFGPLLIDNRGERRRRDLTVRLDAETRFGGAWLRHATTATVERAVWRQEDESREFQSRGSGAFALRTFGLNVRNDIVGLGLTHALHLGERAKLTGGVRLDRLKLNDVRWETPIFPHVSFSWIARPFSPASLGGIRLRGALGHAAGTLQPSLFFFPPTSGDSRPKAEVTRERELGIDVHTLQDRVHVSVTGYHKRTSDVPQLLTGPFFQFGRLEVLNRGIEASLRARILRTSRVTWEAHAWYAHNHNEVTRSDLPPHIIELGDPFTSHLQWVVIGQPLAANRIGTLVSIRDLDGDGLLESVCSADQAQCEVTIGPATDFRPAFPPTSASLSTSVRYGRLTFSVLVDHRSGHTLHNLPLGERCFSRCQALFDPATSIQDQAQALLAGSDEFFVEDAGYTKLRELSIRFSAPASWARAFGAAHLDLSLAGRNLASWSDYGGLDPESASLPWVSLAHVDNAAMPLPRRLLIRADLQGR